MARRAKAEIVDTRRPDAWDRTYGTYISGRAVLDGLDVLAASCEAHWGCGRLRLLVEAELREKFDRQRFKLDAAIREGTLQDVQREGQRMILAWQVLDKEATRIAAVPTGASVWEVTLEDGSVAAIVSDASAARFVQPEGRAVAIYTLDEIGNLLSKFPELAKVKARFSGASVTRISKHVNDPLEGVVASDLEDLNDHIPF